MPARRADAPRPSQIPCRRGELLFDCPPLGQPAQIWEAERRSANVRRQLGYACASRFHHPSVLTPTSYMCTGMRVPVDFITVWYSQEWLHSQYVNANAALDERLILHDSCANATGRNGGIIYQDPRLGSILQGEYTTNSKSEEEDCGGKLT